MSALVAIFLLLGSYFVLEDPFFSELPSWVEPVEIPEVQNVQTSNASDKKYLLQNKQLNVESHEQFEQFVIHILNENSADDHSQIEIDFDPTYQSVTLHELCLYRDGQKLDKKKTSHIEVLNNAPQKDSLVALIDDVQVGDVLSYSYTLQGQEPAYQNHFFLTHFLSGDYPIERNYLRVLLPKEKEVFVKHFASDFSAEQSSMQIPDKDWVLDISQVEKVHYEANTPFWFVQKPHLSLSDFKDWESVAALFTPYYELGNHEIEDLNQLALKLTANSFSLKSKALKLLHFIQEEIESLKPETNPFYPSSPALTLERGAGSSKDKTLLLHGLLKSIGIKSTPVLVSSSLKNTVIEELPSPSAFDHVILSIQLDPKNYFVDPTLSKQGGDLETLYLPPYSYGLPLDQNTTGLVSLPLYELPENSIDVETTYKMENHNHLHIESITTYRGVEADFFRDLFSRSEQNNLRDSLRSYYSSNYGTISDSMLKVKDEPTVNELILSEVYSIDLTRQELGSLPIVPFSLYAYLTQDVDLYRTTPLFQEHPKNIREKIAFTAPVALEISQKNQTFDEPWGHFSYFAKSHKNTFNLECLYQSKKDHILPEELNDFRSYIYSLSTQVPHDLFIPKVKMIAPKKGEIHRDVGLALLALAISITVINITQYYRKYKAEKLPLLFRFPKQVAIRTAESHHRYLKVLFAFSFLSALGSLWYKGITISPYFFALNISLALLSIGMNYLLVRTCAISFVLMVIAVKLFQMGAYFLFSPLMQVEFLTMWAGLSISAIFYFLAFLSCKKIRMCLSPA